ncbi:hypothetical protein MES5069_710012 [Mesorhizobium escarrei]|uniref:Uncharacterized protein n=1 Tax=Mesorhizobium escarrei TaxID=666018 RepID=A0ABM9EHF2_9HYPH|nr:hypothetical protein MES5069_710012 [Mesorhizobium escarrei]
MGSRMSSTAKRENTLAQKFARKSGRDSRAGLWAKSREHSLFSELTSTRNDCFSQMCSGSGLSAFGPEGDLASARSPSHQPPNSRFRVITPSWEAGAVVPLAGPWRGRKAIVIPVRSAEIET